MPELPRQQHISAVSVPRFIKFWLPVIVWMAIIFSASTGVGSSQHTSRIIGPFLRWFNPDISDETIGAIQFGIRKTAHAVEYAILAALLWRARRGGETNERPPWRKSDAVFAIGISALYAVSDEVHQAFVPSRQGHPVDVLIDTLGASVGIWAIWFVGRKLKRW